MDKQEHAAPKNAAGSERHRKREPTQPEPDSLENLDVTRPAPVDQPVDAPTRPQPAGLEQQNVTRPAPPK